MNKKPETVFEPFAAGDLARLKLRSEQGLEQDLLGGRGDAIGSALQETGLGWTARVDGQVVACAGFLVQWPGRATAWALIGDVPWRAWPAITAKVAAEISAMEAGGFWRIEATVRTGFPAGMRWLKALGFKRRCFLRAYDPARGHAWLFERVTDRAQSHTEAAA